VDVCENISGRTISLDISITPNPTSGEINLLSKGLSETIELSLFNLNGQLLEKYSMTGSQRITLNHLPNSIYLLYCSKTGKTFKIIKTD